MGATPTGIYLANLTTGNVVTSAGNLNGKRVYRVHSIVTKKLESTIEIMDSASLQALKSAIKILIKKNPNGRRIHWALIKEN